MCSCRPFEAAGLRVAGAAATMYLWCEVPGREPAEGCSPSVCRERGLLVSPGPTSGPSGEGYVRLSLVPTSRSASARPRRSGSSWPAVDQLAPERVEEVVAALDRGERRVAAKHDGEWVVDEEAKAASWPVLPAPSHGAAGGRAVRVPRQDPAQAGLRAPRRAVVPPAVARYGSFLPRGVVMPSYVNIGAWVGPRTMVDTWATIGSCAQVGRTCTSAAESASAACWSR